MNWENFILAIGELILMFFRYLFWLLHHHNWVAFALFIIILISVLRVVGLGFNSLRFYLIWRKQKAKTSYLSISYELFQDTWRGILWTSCLAATLFNLVFWF